jgi:acylphosphatase
MTLRAPDPTARLEATVRGRVQGVGFRYFAARAASRLGLDGWVANEPDGTVRCVAEGPLADLETFLAELREGPPSAGVTDVGAVWGPVRGEGPGFGVRTGAHRGD